MLVWLWATPAAAQEAEQVHWAVGLGGYWAPLGPSDFGGAAEVEVYPGGAFGRFGLRAATWGLDTGDPADALVTAGVTYSAGSARPHLHVALHADVGVTTLDPRPALGGGVQTQLWVFGPLALGFDAVAYLLADDGIDLVLASATTLRLSF